MSQLSKTLMFRSKCISFNKNKMHAWHKCKQWLSTKRQLCVNTTKRQDIKNHMLLNENNHLKCYNLFHKTINYYTHKLEPIDNIRGLYINNSMGLLTKAKNPPDPNI